MDLQDLISNLSLYPEEATIAFDNGDYVQKFDSWRGIYTELSMEPVKGSRDAFGREIPHHKTVGQVLAAARAAVGATFEGYKGGEYRMNEYTRVWADEYGSALGRAPMGFFYTEYRFKTDVPGHLNILTVVVPFDFH